MGARCRGVDLRTGPTAEIRDTTVRAAARRHQGNRRHNIRRRPQDRFRVHHQLQRCHGRTGSETSDAIRMRQIDAFTAEAELSLAGRVVGQTRRVVSPDGMTMTITLRRDAPVAVNNVTVYRRR